MRGFMSHKSLLAFVSIAMAFCFGSNAKAQTGSYDVFIPIAKYIRLGDAEKLSAWFDDNLEISILSNSSDSSKNQAKRIVKSFFDSYTPRGFDITHTAGRTNMKYAIGRLNAGGELFEVTVFVTFKEQTYKIQQLKIMKKE